MWQNVNKFADRNLCGICQSNFFLSDSKIHMSKTLSNFPSKCIMKFLFCHQVCFNNFLTLMFILCINGPFFLVNAHQHTIPHKRFLSLALASLLFISAKGFDLLEGVWQGHTAAARKILIKLVQDWILKLYISI